MRSSRRLLKKQAGRRFVALLALSLIILVPTTPPSFVHQRKQQQQHFSVAYLAQATYLDEAARAGELVGQLVDALLEKVSFLCELIIESASQEQCDFSAPNSCQQVEGKNLSDALERTKKPTNSLSDNQLDELEFANVSLFLRQAERLAQRPASTTSGCKLFNLALNKADLPIEEMELCCSNYEFCYARCRAEKQVCDLEFKLCLEQECKSKFHHNHQLERAHHQLEERRVEPEAKRKDADKWPEGERETRRKRDNYKACKLATKVLIIGNLAFGCQKYKRLQAAACCTLFEPKKETFSV